MFVLTSFLSPSAVDLSHQVAKSNEPEVVRKTKKKPPTGVAPGYRHQRTHSFVGTEEYIPPEMVRKDGHDESVDWWTLGVLIFEMLSGTTPFAGTNRRETWARIVEGEIKWHHKVSASPEVKSLVSQLLHPEPSKRLGANNGAMEIRNHPFFAGVKWPLLRQEVPPMKIKLEHPLDTSNFRQLPLEQDEGRDSMQLHPGDPFDGHFVNMDKNVMAFSRATLGKREETTLADVRNMESYVAPGGVARTAAVRKDQAKRTSAANKAVVAQPRTGISNTDV